MKARYTKLKDDSWGVRASGAIAAKAGDVLSVKTKAGATKTATIDRVLWTGDDPDATGNIVSLCSIVAEPRAPGRQSSEPNDNLQHKVWGDEGGWLE
jgi:hypothetical protein